MGSGRKSLGHAHGRARRVRGRSSTRPAGVRDQSLGSAGQPEPAPWVGGARSNSTADAANGPSPPAVRSQRPNLRFSGRELGAWKPAECTRANGSSWTSHATTRGPDARCHPRQPAEVPCLPLPAARVTALARMPSCTRSAPRRAVDSHPPAESGYRGISCHAGVAATRSTTTADPRPRQCVVRAGRRPTRTPCKGLSAAALRAATPCLTQSSPTHGAFPQMHRHSRTLPRQYARCVLVLRPAQERVRCAQPSATTLQVPAQ